MFGFPYTIKFDKKTEHKTSLHIRGVQLKKILIIETMLYLRKVATQNVIVQITITIK